MVAVDAMGGDYAPRVVVEGACAAAQRGIPILLFGDRQAIESHLDTYFSKWRSLPITIEPCTQVIGMADEPTRAVVRKKDASLVRAALAVKEGRASALVSAGNSGAVLVASTLILGRVPGVLRPALGNFLPTHTGQIFCLDLGANTNCKPEFLEQFAAMGSLYVQQSAGIEHPRVALLSNGHEPYKGSAEIKETYARLEKREDLNFVGNVESRDVFDGHADVLVTDGFVGNVLIKGIQGTMRSVFAAIQHEARTSWFKKLCALFAWPLFSALKRKTDYQRFGGALLLGVNQPVIVAHGSAQAHAIMQSIIFAAQTIQNKRVEHFNAALADMLKKHRGLAETVKDTMQSVLQWVKEKN